MNDIIKTLRESNIELLKAEAADLSKWSKLKHIKKDFELFLQFNIAEVSFKTIDEKDSKIICTSNAALIKILQCQKLEDKEKLVKFKGPGINCKDKDFVKTWDIQNNTFKTISLNSWQIENFISISPKNILILDELIRNLLK